MSLVKLRHCEVKATRDFFTNNGTQADNKAVKYTWNGEPASHSIYLVPPSRGSGQVKYTIGGKWTAFRSTVGIPKIEETSKRPASALTFEVLGDGKSL